MRKHEFYIPTSPTNKTLRRVPQDVDISTTEDEVWDWLLKRATALSYYEDKFSEAIKSKSLVLAKKSDFKRLGSKPPKDFESKNYWVDTTMPNTPIVSGGFLFPPLVSYVSDEDYNTLQGLAGKHPPVLIKILGSTKVEIAIAIKTS